MVLQVALLGSCIVTHRAVELPWVNVQLHMFLEIAPVGCFVVAVWAVQGLGPIVNLPRMASHFVLIRGHVAALITFKWLLT